MQKTQKQFVITALPSFQGDVMLRKVNEVPPGFVEDTSPEALIIAHSETGHHHTLHDLNEDVVVCDHHDGVKSNAKVKVFRNKDNIFDAFLVVSEPAKVVHHRTTDTHDSYVFPAGVYHVGRQQEYSPFGVRRSQD